MYPSLDWDEDCNLSNLSPPLFILQKMVCEWEKGSFIELEFGVFIFSGEV